MEYPVWVCTPCGQKYGRAAVGVATWHMGTCDVCGEKAGVTEPRDYGHLKDNWKDGRKNDRQRH